MTSEPQQARQRLRAGEFTGSVGFGLPAKDLNLSSQPDGITQVRRVRGWD